MFGGLGTACRSGFSPSTMWVPPSQPRLGTWQPMNFSILEIVKQPFKKRGGYFAECVKYINSARRIDAHL